VFETACLKAVKGTIFFSNKKMPKMAKPFYFWQTVSKMPNGSPVIMGKSSSFGM